VIQESTGEIFTWRGPAPYHFVRVPEEECVELQAAASRVSYGWGVIPVTAQIGTTTWMTSLFPKDGGYLVPVKDAVRRAEGLEEGDTVSLQLTVGT
jgi:hypothetical protein